MVTIYCNLIKAHIRTIEQVPVKDQQKVLDALALEGLDGYGNPLSPAEPTQA